MSATETTTAQVDGLRLAYRELGDGPPVLLLHGWPTSSFLWREVMKPIARANRVVALDLPGFGASDKPVGIRYGFDFFGHALDLFLAHSASISWGSRSTSSAARSDCIGPSTTPAG
jgi:pimeloyl-ACP methyl ester carboxylesterase